MASSENTNLNLRIKNMSDEYTTLLGAEESLKEVLRGISEERKKAEREFSKQKREIARITSSVIDVYSYDLESRIRNAIHTANNAGEKLNSACLRLIVRLDTKCSLLYQDAVDPDIAEQIVKELHELNEAATVDIDFSGALNGVSFGHVGAIKYSPTSDTLRAEARWEVIAKEARKKGGIGVLLDKYGITKAEWNDHKKYEKAVLDFGKAESTAQMSKVKSVFKALGDFRDSKDYVKKCDEKIPFLIEKEARDLMEERKKAEEAKAREAEEQAKKAAKEASEKNAYIGRIKQAISGIDKSVKDAEKAIEKKNNADGKKLDELRDNRAALGFFKFSEKKAIAIEIAMAEENIAERSKKLCELKAEKEAQIKKAEAGLRILGASIGEEVLFGKQFYSRGTLPMEWIVVGTKDGVISLLAKHTVACKRPYELDKRDYLNDVESYWLSNTFQKTVFSEEDVSVLEYVRRDGSTRKVFLPLVDEVRLAGAAMKATPEESWENAGLAYFDNNKACHYWIGGFDYSSSYISDVSYITPDGMVRVAQGNAFAPYGVRPMIAINMKKLCENIMKALASSSSITEAIETKNKR